MTLREEAREVALEQVLHWRSFLTAREAAAAVGLTGGCGHPGREAPEDRTWAAVAERLAQLWIGLQNIQTKRAA